MTTRSVGTIYETAEPNRQRQIDKCRAAAKLAQCRVIIRAERTDRRGNTHYTPVVDISPDGDVTEIPAATMRTSMGDLFMAQYQRSATGLDNIASAKAVDRMTRIVAESEHDIATRVAEARAKAQAERERRERRLHKQQATGMVQS